MVRDFSRQRFGSRSVAITSSYRNFGWPACRRVSSCQGQRVILPHPKQPRNECHIAPREPLGAL